MLLLSFSWPAEKWSDETCFAVSPAVAQIKFTPESAGFQSFSRGLLKVKDLSTAIRTEDS
jgi:hypothetical protein